MNFSLMVIPRQNTALSYALLANLCNISVKSQYSMTSSWCCSGIADSFRDLKFGEFNVHLPNVYSLYIHLPNNFIVCIYSDQISIAQFIFVLRIITYTCRVLGKTKTKNTNIFPTEKVMMSKKAQANIEQMKRMKCKRQGYRFSQLRYGPFTVSKENILLLFLYFEN